VALLVSSFYCQVMGTICRGRVPLKAFFFTFYVLIRSKWESPDGRFAALKWELCRDRTVRNSGTKCNQCVIDVRYPECLDMVLVVFHI
jgi:hypothetical protein